MERLAELREQRALTLRELSAMSGVAADTINQIELGHRKPRPSTLRKLAKALNVEPRELITPQEVAPPSITSGEAVGEPRALDVQAVGVARGRSSAHGELTVTVSVPLTLRWNVAEALKSGKKLDPDELRELEEAARAQLTGD